MREGVLTSNPLALRRYSRRGKTAGCHEGLDPLASGAGERPEGCAVPGSAGVSPAFEDGGPKARPCVGGGENCRRSADCSGHAGETPALPGEARQPNDQVPSSAAEQAPTTAACTLLSDGGLLVPV